MSNDLDVAKQKLLEKLGPNYNGYIQLLARWFRGIIPKEEFDKSAKLLVEDNFVLEHNKFWLAFFRHCASSASGHHSFHSPLATHDANLFNDINEGNSSDPKSSTIILNDTSKVRCLPNRVLTHMKTYVIAWEMGLDDANDQVSNYINLALHHFLKNIITEVICAKTAYRLRENKFKYALGVKPMNPYLNNSLRVYASNLEYDPYAIESTKMNSSLLDTCQYNDTLFPSRLYEAQALYEYACSTTSFSRRSHTKRLKLSDIFINHDDETSTFLADQDDIDYTSNKHAMRRVAGQQCQIHPSNRVLSLMHLMIAFLTNRTLIPAKSLYSVNLERIFNKLSSKEFLELE